MPSPTTLRKSNAIHPSTCTPNGSTANKHKRTEGGAKEGSSKRNISARRQRLKRRTRTWIHAALLPLLYLAFLSLHCLFALGQLLLDAAASAQRKRRTRRDCSRHVQERLWEIGDEQRGISIRSKVGPLAAALRVPKHLALLLPPTPPTTPTLIGLFVQQGFQRLFDSLGGRQGSSRSGHLLRPPRQSKHWETHRGFDLQNRFRCLQAILKDASLAGVPTVSLWDEGGLSQLIKRDRAFVAKRNRWTLHVYGRGPHANAAPLAIHVDVWDSHKRRNVPESPEGCHLHTQDGSLHVKLNILTPENDGRAAFASVSHSIAEVVVGKTRELGPGSTGDGNSRDNLINRLTVSDIDNALADGHYPTSEPDLLLCVSPSFPARTISEYCRWTIRVTEICHTRTGAETYNVVDFWDALRQFTKAEQRYGR